VLNFLNKIFMSVFIDAHTHHSNTGNPFAVRNLNFDDVEDFLNSGENEFCTLGIHPWDVHNVQSDVLEKVETWASDPRIKAIGECGLDKNSKATIKEQAFFFERQVAISEKLLKPVIIHCVAAFNEIIALRKKFKPLQTWIIHGYRGKPQMTKLLLNAGFALSFGEHYNPLSVELTPIDKLCVETDLGEKPIEHIYKGIALIKGCLPEELNGACQLLKLYVCS
jgi:TatD DNase family protein